MVCGSWNVKAGLVKRELEIRNLLETEKLDVLFLNETDTLCLLKESDFAISGFVKILPLRKNYKEKVRLICLVKEKLMNSITIRKDLMSTEFPSIWLELKS